MSGIELTLDRECWRCYGTGRTFQNWKDSSGDHVHCDTCDGVGRTPTEAGREILEFVKRHLRTQVGEPDAV